MHYLSGDSRIAEDNVRAVLNSNFCTEKGREIALQDIEEILKDNNAFQGVDAWSSTEIADFVCSVFSVQSYKKKIRRKMKDKTAVYPTI